MPNPHTQSIYQSILPPPLSLIPTMHPTYPLVTILTFPAKHPRNTLPHTPNLPILSFFTTTLFIYTLTSICRNQFNPVRGLDTKECDVGVVHGLAAVSRGSGSSSDRERASCWIGAHCDFSRVEVYKLSCWDGECLIVPRREPGPCIGIRTSAWKWRERL